ncbi:hypothetical protein [Paenibacillus qinlingensis]|uniref:hypothetical protein n=1 Tax=Paenibacillus qinlingensis TaxID=1837343 RepID=UPI0015665704|nr:hypothetical protein [Paenibacillus qinlingensis]NQX63916.1 hypothetical protein [Paenibacillus qinlingensis]
MKRIRGYKKIGSKRKVVAGIVSLTVILTASAGISFADTDLVGSMTSWFAKKTGQVMQSLDVSLKSETETQKALLKKELQLRLEASASSLDAFTEEQKRSRREVLEQYAQSLLAKVDFQSMQDREQVLSKLQTIVDSAQAGMDELVGSYVPPALTFVPTVPIVQNVPTQQPSTVTVDVYGQQPPPTTVIEVTYSK